MDLAVGMAETEVEREEEEGTKVSSTSRSWLPKRKGETFTRSRAEGKERRATDSVPRLSFACSSEWAMDSKWDTRLSGG